MSTSNVCCGMVGLTVYTEAALLHSPQLLQLLVQQIYCLLHTLPLGHGHLAHTARYLTQEETSKLMKTKVQQVKPQSISEYSSTFRLTGSEYEPRMHKTVSCLK